MRIGVTDIKAFFAENLVVSCVSSLLAVLLMLASVLFALSERENAGEIASPEVQVVAPRELLESALDYKEAPTVDNRAKLESDLDGYSKKALDQASNRLNLDELERENMLDVYHENEGMLKERFFQTLKNEVKSEADSELISYHNFDGAEDLAHSMSKHATSTLLLLVPIISKRSPSGEVLDVLIGHVVNPILDEVFLPLSEGLTEAGMVRDINQSELIIRDRISHTIAEVATTHQMFDVSFTERWKKEVAFLPDSEAFISVAGKGGVKAGFDLSEGIEMEVNHDSKSISILLPAAKILSVEVYPRILDQEGGWLIPLGREKYNSVLGKARQEVIKDALRTDILMSAEENAIRLISDLYGPLMNRPGVSYSLKVSVTSKHEERVDL